jgi:hypothetical protein
MPACLDQAPNPLLLLVRGMPDCKFGNTWLKYSKYSTIGHDTLPVAWYCRLYAAASAGPETLVPRASPSWTDREHVLRFCILGRRRKKEWKRFTGITSWGNGSRKTPTPVVLAVVVQSTTCYDQQTTNTYLDSP